MRFVCQYGVQYFLQCHLCSPILVVFLMKKRSATRKERSSIRVYVFLVIALLSCAALLILHNTYNRGAVRGSKTDDSSIHRIGYIRPIGLEQIDRIPYDQFDTLIYRGVQINSNGAIRRRTDKTYDIAWQKLYTQTYNAFVKNAHTHNTTVLVEVALSDDADITMFSSDVQVQKHAIEDITRLLQLRPIDGVHIRIDHIPDEGTLQHHHIEALINVVNAVQTHHPSMVHSISISQDIATKMDALMMQSLSEKVAYITIMGYDMNAHTYTRPQTIAPVDHRSGGKSLRTTLEHIRQIAPETPIALVLPLFGHEWQMDSDQPDATIIAGTAYSLTYDETKDIPSHTLRWDDIAQSASYLYTYEDKHYQIHFETVMSIQRKVNVARNYNTWGVGFDSIDMTMEDEALWDVVYK